MKLGIIRSDTQRVHHTAGLSPASICSMTNVDPFFCVALHGGTTGCGQGKVIISPSNTFNKSLRIQSYVLCSVNLC